MAQHVFVITEQRPRRPETYVAAASSERYAEKYIFDRYPSAQKGQREDASVYFCQDARGDRLMFVRKKPVHGG